MSKMRIILVLSIQFIALPYIFAQTEAWQRINPIPVESSLSDISLLPNNRVVAVGSGATVIYSDNDGEDWEIIYKPGNISRKVAFNKVDFADNLHGMAVGSYYSIIRTDDGGENWTNISPGADFHYFEYTDVSFSDASNCFVAGVHFAQSFLLHTADGGLSWDTSFHTSQRKFSKIQFVDENTGFLSAVNDSNYFYKSTDGGENWDKITVDAGIEGMETGYLYFIDANTGFYGASVAEENNWYPVILKTVDGGLNWHLVFTDNFAGAKEFFFLDHDTGFAVSNIVWYSNDILKTTDGGETWMIINDDIGFWSFKGICMNNNGNGLIVGGSGQIYRSIDFGNNWEAACSNQFPRFTIDRAFITGDSSVLANMYGGVGGIISRGVIESSDRGLTWNESVSFPDGIRAYYAVNADIVIHGSRPGGIYKSENGGNDWVFHEVDNPDFQPLSIDFTDEQTGFAGGTREDNGMGMELYKTTDQGENWSRINSEVFNHVDPFYQLEFINDSTGFIAGDVGYDSLCNYLVTHDQGNTWEIDTLPYKYDFNGVLFIDGQTGFLYGWRKVCKTINGGLDWSLVEIDENADLNAISMSFPSPQTGYLINGSGSNQSMFKTSDGGDSWYSIDPPTTADIFSVNFFTNNEGIIVGGNSIIFKTETGGIVEVPEPGDLLPQTVLKCYPNPFSYRTQLISSTELYGEITIRIFDFMGRKIISHCCPTGNAEEIIYNWNGKDHYGNEAPAGVYLICLEGLSIRETIKVIKL